MTLAERIEKVISAERIEKFNNLMGDIVPPEVKKDLLDNPAPGP